MNPTQQEINDLLKVIDDAYEKGHVSELARDLAHSYLDVLNYREEYNDNTRKCTGNNAEDNR